MPDPPTAARSAATARRVALVDSGLGLLGYADALHIAAARPRPRAVARPRQHALRPALARRGEAAHPRLGSRDAALRARCRGRGLQHRLGARLEALRAELEPAHPGHRHRARHPPRSRDGRPRRRCGRRPPRPRATTCAVSSTPSPPTSRPMPSRRSASPRRSRPETPPPSTSASRMPSSRTPAGVRALVLGCTHYGLVTDRIVAALGGDVTVFDSPVAVARQTLRRIGLAPDPSAARGGGVEAVLLAVGAGAAPGLAGRLPGRRPTCWRPPGRPTIAA